VTRDAKPFAKFATRFTVFLDSGANIEVRRKWIEALRSGEDPFAGGIQ